MSAIIYPIQFLRRLNRRWSAQVERLTDARRSRPSGTDSCACGHHVIAPRNSTYSATAVINEWQCTACGRSWKTYAGSVAPEASPT